MDRRFLEVAGVTEYPPMYFSMQRQQLYENKDWLTLWNDDDSIITECLCNPTTGMWWYKTYYVDEDCWHEARPRWVPQRDILCCNPTAKRMVRCRKSYKYGATSIWHGRK